MLHVTISKRGAVMIALALALVIPGVAGATHVFDDVADGSTHAPGIEWVAGAGVTTGCGDGSVYCPDDPVTRAQMGTFMYRLSGNASGVSPSVNADTLDGLDAADLQTAAFSTFNDGPVTTDFIVGREVIRLDLPAGSYVIIAKAWLDHQSGVDVTAECTLSAGVDFDQARVGLDQGTSLLDTASVAMTVVHTFTADGSAVLECDELAFNADLNVYDAKITAIGVDSLSNVFGG